MFNIHALAGKLVDIFLQSNQDKSSYKMIYDYGMEILLSTIANIIFVLVLSIVLKIKLEVICYCSCFLPFRFVFKGVHAKTHFTCIASFLVCMLVSVLIARLLAYSPLIIWLEAVILCISLLINFRFAKRIETSYEKSSLN